MVDLPHLGRRPQQLRLGFSFFEYQYDDLYRLWNKVLWSWAYLLVPMQNISSEFLPLMPKTSISWKSIWIYLESQIEFWKGIRTNRLWNIFACSFFVFWARDPIFWLQLCLFEAVKMGGEGSDFTKLDISIPKTAYFR